MSNFSAIKCLKGVTTNAYMICIKTFVTMMLIVSHNLTDKSKLISLMRIWLHFVWFHGVTSISKAHGLRPDICNLTFYFYSKNDNYFTQGGSSIWWTSNKQSNTYVSFYQSCNFASFKNHLKYLIFLNLC